ncbi:PREDICTED: protein Skeletor, isoforms B/C isoform X4 [Polistes dominula]|uniref:Protein Skeletor, isoforms B/C isoform X4 n=1 Tax=Polistes dominula TaxID=743375 RepID=A0ABM1INK2_POLDO|nr:PREDICTED: protein Skeletor, isoforms B/C isoform X4 [Polistes dominula]
MTTRSPTTSPSDRRSTTIGLVLTIFFIFLAQLCDGAYYGKLIGKLSELHHGVSGEVYAVDGRTLFIKDFTYDGEGPAAFFYAGNSKSPNSNGFRVRDERGTANVLKRYRRKDITLTLPDGKTLNSIKWFSVWCDEFAVNFGDVRIPRGLDYPKPQKLAALSGVHGVSSEPIVIVDAQTLLIPGFSYDGEAPDAKFWVGAGPSPSPQGIRVPDENGKEQPLRRYDRKTIVLTLPGDLTVHQIGHFGVWCEAFTVDFGHIQIPQGLNVPPSLKMLGVSPQTVHRGGQGQTGILDLQNLHEISSSILSPAASSSSSTLSATFPPSLIAHQQQQQQRPTTYRPILRRDDQIQVVQSIDYRIPKSLQVPDVLTRQQNPVQQSATFQFNEDIPNLGRLRQLANIQTSDDSSIHHYRHQDGGGSSSSSSSSSSTPSSSFSFSSSPNSGSPSRQQQQSGRARSRTHQSDPQQNSYSRVLRYQGDRRVDSFVRY